MSSLTDTPFLAWTKGDLAWEQSLERLAPFTQAVWARAQSVAAGASGRGPRSCAMAGAVPGDGASTIAAALAHHLAQGLGLRTVLVETDLRAPQLVERGRAPRTPGLLGALQRDVRLRHAVVELPRVGFCVMPAGGSPAAPATVLDSLRLAEVMGGLFRHFDVVLFDTPPLATAPEARHIVALAEVTVPVLRSGRASPEHAAHWLGRIGEMGGKIGAVCLNAVEQPLPGWLRRWF